MTKFYYASIHPEAEEKIRGHAGFVPASQYGKLAPVAGEIGSVECVRYIVSGEPGTEFVTTTEFEVLMAHPDFVRGSAIQGHIFNITYISLVPPERV
jgi:hypothetical protein